MKQRDLQLDRLLRAAAAAQQRAALELSKAPAAAWFLAQQEEEQEPIFPGAFAMLRRGLATACVLLVVTGAVSLREFRKAENARLNLVQTMVVLARGAPLR